MSCSVCFTSFEEVSPINLPCSCIHCAECLVSWIKTEIVELKYHTNAMVKCMSCECQASFIIQDVLAQFSTKLQEELNSCLLNFYLRSTKDIRKCPKENCNFAGIIDLKNPCNKDLECSSCGTMWKEKVQSSASEGSLSVLLDLDFRPNEIYSHLWEEFYTNKCPSCSTNIEKNGGCPHMTCKRCGYEFCWHCKQLYSTHLPRMCVIKFGAKLTFFILFFYHTLCLAGFLPILSDIILWSVKFALKTILLNSLLYPLRGLLFQKNSILSALSEMKTKIMVSVALLSIFWLLIHIFGIYVCIFKIFVLEAMILFCTFVSKTWFSPWLKVVY